MPKQPKQNTFDWVSKRVASQQASSVSIFPQDAAPVSPAAGPQIQYIAPQFLHRNPFQTRVDDQSVDSLVDKMNDVGFIGSLTARPHPDQIGHYQIAFGHRRLAAAEKAKIDVPVVVRELTDLDMLLQAFSENREREDLTPWEDGIMFLQMDRKFGLTQDEIARRVGEGKNEKIDRGYVRNRIFLAELAEQSVQVREYLMRNPHPNLRAMRSLAGLDEDGIAYILNGMEHNGWGADQAEQRVKTLKEGGQVAELLLHPGSEDVRYQQAPALPSEETRGQALILAAGGMPNQMLSVADTVMAASPSAHIDPLPPTGVASVASNGTQDRSDRIGKAMDRSLLVKGSVKQLRKYVHAVKEQETTKEEVTVEEVGALTEISLLVREMLTILGLQKTGDADGTPE